MSLEVANPSDKSWTRHSFILWFGAYGPKHVLCYANGPEDALEIAAELLVERGWKGLCVPHEDVKSSVDLGCDCLDPFECDSHTYTESGWLTSYEWGIMAEDPTKAQILELSKQN